jgi:hypothetical protein
MYVGNIFFTQVYQNSAVLNPYEYISVYDIIYNGQVHFSKGILDCTYSQDPSGNILLINMREVIMVKSVNMHVQQ